MPIFYPSRDTLTFSEHLLGVAVVAAPIEWLTGNPVVAYNLTLVASFALSAAAMFALAYRLTGSVAAAFIGGLAYGFAPYRISQLPHIQMEVLWYAPLALLGLHAYLETGRRPLARALRRGLDAAGRGQRLRAGLSVRADRAVGGLVRRACPGAGAISSSLRSTTVVAVLPLAPILFRYIRVHEYYGMVRGIEEIRAFSADISGVLCAPPALAFWGWVRVGCRPEGELFPGVAVFVHLRRRRREHPEVGTAVPLRRPARSRSIIRLLLAVATVYAAIAVSVWWFWGRGHSRSGRSARRRHRSPSRCW